MYTVGEIDRDYPVEYDGDLEPSTPRHPRLDVALTEALRHPSHFYGKVIGVWEGGRLTHLVYDSDIFELRREQ